MKKISKFYPTFKDSDHYVLGRQVIDEDGVVTYDVYCRGQKGLNEKAEFYNMMKPFDNDEFTMGYWFLRKVFVFNEPKDAYKKNMEDFNGVLSIYKVRLEATLEEIDKESAKPKVVEKRKPMKRTKVRQKRRVMK